MVKKTFLVLDTKGNVLSTFQNSKPSDAAKKAASAGHRQVLIQEKGSSVVRTYHAALEPIKNPTEFTKKHNITQKPRVKYQGSFQQIQVPT